MAEHYPKLRTSEEKPTTNIALRKADMMRFKFQSR